MVSFTQQTSRIRRRKQTTNGRVNKRLRRANGTPAFPIHIEAAPQSTEAQAAESKPST
ncbi:MAG: hypothetical protein R3A52_03670 [Polyangiales bacterium]